MAIASAEFLDPQALSQLGNLQLISQRVVEGLLGGIHRSPYHGASVEFAEHRLYTPGDDLRAIDWRAFARSDRYYIKEFEAFTNAPVTLVLDASGSMGFAHSTLTKLFFSQIAVACIGRLALYQRDAVGLVVTGKALQDYLPPRAIAGQLAIMCNMMANVEGAGEGTVASALTVLAKQQRRRGMVLVFSDCFEDTNPLVDGMHGLRARGHDVTLFHVMAPEELSFSFDRWSRFVSLEDASQVRDLEPSVVRKAYLKRVRLFIDELKRGCGRAGVHYAPMTTAEPPGLTLSLYLRVRAARRASGVA